MRKGKKSDVITFLMLFDRRYPVLNDQREEQNHGIKEFYSSFQKERKLYALEFGHADVVALEEFHGEITQKTG